MGGTRKGEYKKHYWRNQQVRRLSGHPSVNLSVCTSKDQSMCLFPVILSVPRTQTEGGPASEAPLSATSVSHRRHNTLIIHTAITEPANKANKVSAIQRITGNLQPPLQIT